jgi:hypothetical protein
MSKNQEVGNLSPKGRAGRAVLINRHQPAMPLINILLLNQYAVGGANLLVSIITQPARPFRRRDRLPLEFLIGYGSDAVRPSSQLA